MDTRRGPLDNTRLVSHHPLISRVHSACNKGTTTGYPIYQPFHKNFTRTSGAFKQWLSGWRWFIWNFTTMPHSAGLTRCKAMSSMASVAVLATCAAQCRSWCQWMPGTQVPITNGVLSYLTNIMAGGIPARLSCCILSSSTFLLFSTVFFRATRRTPQGNEEGILIGPIEFWVVAPLSCFTPEMSLGASTYCCKSKSP